MDGWPPEAVRILEAVQAAGWPEPALRMDPSAVRVESGSWGSRLEIGALPEMPLPLLLAGLGAAGVELGRVSLVGWDTGLIVLIRLDPVEPAEGG